MKTYNVTRVNLSGVVVTDKSGKPQTEEDGSLKTESLEYITEKEATEILENHAKQGWPSPEVTKSQTFTQYEAESVSEISGLVPDEAVAVDIFNRGAVLKQQGFMRSFMKDSDQVAVEGSYDLAAALAAPPSERRKADPRSKAMKALADLGIQIDPSQFDAILAQFQAAQV